MAKLIQCKTCNGAVSSNAKSCPLCGEKSPRKSEVTRVLGWCIGIALVFTWIGSFSNTTPETPEQTKARAQASLERQLDVQRVNWGVATATVLKGAMRNPDSFVVEEVWVTEKLVACVKYRAQNGFGGMNRDRVIASSTEVLQDDDSSRFSSRWVGCFENGSHDFTSEVNARL